MEFEARQSGKRLVHCGQQLRRVFRWFIGHVEDDPTHAIGICKSRDHPKLCAGQPDSRFKIDNYRQGRETAYDSYRNPHSRSVLREEEPYVQT